jgi:hypothetical protein
MNPTFDARNDDVRVELVFKELNHLAAILHVYARGLNFMKWNFFFVIIFQKENGDTFTPLIIFIVKSLQKEQNSTNLPLWPPICQNKPAITPKWFNSLDTNSRLFWLQNVLDPNVLLHTVHAIEKWP